MGIKQLGFAACGIALACALLLMLKRPSAGPGDDASLSRSANTAADVPQPKDAALTDTASPTLEPAPPALAAAPVMDSDAQGSTGGAAPGSPVVVTELTSPVDAEVAIVHGLVTDANGAPVPKPWLMLQDGSGAQSGIWGDEAGRYLFVDVSPGTARVRIGGTTDWIGQEQTAQLAPGGEARADFTVEPIRTIGLRCSSDGTRKFYNEVAEIYPSSVRIQPFVTKERPPSILNPPHAGGNNSYGVGSWWDRRQVGQPETDAVDDLGVLLVDAEFPVWASLALGNVVVYTERVDQSGTELTWRIDPRSFTDHLATLQFRVVDDRTGDPMGATFRLDRRQAEAVLEDTQIDQLPGGLHTVRFAAEGKAERVMEVNLIGGQTTDLGDVRLQDPITLSGVVSTPEGDGIQASLRIQSEATGVEHRSGSAANGTFALGALNPGRYHIRIVGDDERKIIGDPDTLWSSQSITVDATGGSVSKIAVSALSVTRVAIRTSVETAPLTITVEGLDGGEIRRRDVSPGQSMSLKLPRGSALLRGWRDDQIVVERVLSIGTTPLSVQLNVL